MRVRRLDDMISVLIVAVLALCPGDSGAQTIPGALPESAAALTRGEWPAYTGTYASARYSPLDQINRENAKSLRVVNGKHLR